jgi:hypothetical protein
MGDKLIAGGVDPTSFANSMAGAIEDALNALLDAAGKDRLPADDTEQTRDRRRLFVAIATGVVEHLKANPAAFKVVFTNLPPGTEAIAAKVEIQ